MARVNVSQRRISRRRLASGALVASGGLMLAACGSDAKNTPAGSANGTTSAAGTGAVTKQLVKGGTFKFSIGGDPPNLDMHANSTYLVNNILAPVYNQLVRFDPLVAEEPPEAIISDLAKSWAQSPDGLTYSFKLHEGVSFHDGKPFSAADVKASLERIGNPPKSVVSPRQESLAVIDRIETPDALTVVIRLKRPTPSLLLILAQGWMSIYSAQDIAAGFDFKLKTNGTGPFILKDYIRGNRAELLANPTYFVRGQPYLDGITIFVQPDQGAIVSAFQSGQTVYSTRFSESDVQGLEAILGKKMVTERRNSLSAHTINFGHQAPWRDPRVQRAVSLAMNRQEAIDLLYEGKGTIGGYMPPGGGWSLTNEEIQQMPGYAPFSDKTLAEAKQLLQAAGVRQGHQSTLLTRRGKSFEDLSIFIKDQLAKVGIDARAQVLEDAAAYDALNNRNYDLGPWTQTAALDDPDAVFAESYLSNSPRNYSGIGSPEVDALFEKQSQTLSLPERKKLVKELQQKAMPLYSKIAVAWNSRRTSWWTSVQGYVSHGAAYNNNRHAETWLDKG